MEQNPASPTILPALHPLAEPFFSKVRPMAISSQELAVRIESEIRDVPSRALLREFNHANLKIVSKQLGRELTGARVLDVGASVHGYALECAIALDYREYIGIDLGITRNWGVPFVEVSHEAKRHMLCQMDAHRLWIEDESADVVLCLSGFEHYLYPEMVLQEIMRVLRKGGVALISHEPIWTCSYGHHLHHFGIGFEQVPPWSHLFLTKSQMADLLAGKSWPTACRINRAQAVEWIYDGRDINRRDFNFHHNLLRQLECGEVFWFLPQEDAAPQALASVDFVATVVPYLRHQLLTRGFSFCFRK
jgi:SAM-dependent methyltransferase